MDLTVYYNGELLRNSEVRLPVHDHGLLYGDGVRIPIRIYGKRPFMLSRHLENLFYSLDRLGIEIDLTEKTLEKTIRVLLDLNSLSDALVSVIVTRGEGDFSFTPNLKRFPHVLVMADPPPEVSEALQFQGARLFLGEFRAYPKSFFDRQIHTLSRQHEILTLYAARKNKAFEGLWANMEGYLCEGSRSNLFLVKNGSLYTPDLECGLRNRVARHVAMKIAAYLEIPVFEGFLTLKDLHEAAECFITSTEIEILPAVSVNGRDIGDGRPGRVTTRIRETFKKIVRGDRIELA
jgi:branched-chain amino acid aminotransferase